MKRIWCWLGLHDWLTYYETSLDGHVHPMSRRCVRCDKEEDWLPEWAP